jgi:NitT/TauT family transport system substrate-binding protein
MGLLARVALAAACLLTAATAQAATLKLGVLKFGTVAWEMEVIRQQGLDARHGITIETVELASNDAGRIALMSGAVDMIVSDLIFVARQRGEGVPLVFQPFSSAVGAVMTGADSGIASWRELRGKRLGVAGGPLDKSWVLLQAVAKATDGIDLAKEAQVVFGAPPLIAEKLRQRELDAGLLFWNFAARLSAEGYRTAFTMAAVEEALGASGPGAIVGYVFDETRMGSPAQRQALAAFFAASRDAKRLMRTDDSVWTAVRPLMQAKDEAAFAALKAAFIAGIPTRPLEVEERDAERLFRVLHAAGGEKLVGKSATLPAGTFHRPAGAGH